MRRKKKSKKQLRQQIKTVFAKIGTLNLILGIVAIFFIWFNMEMIQLFRECGSMPESYACAVVAATIGECGICGWIRTTKDKRQDRSWQKEDRKAEQEHNEQYVPDIDVGDIPESEEKTP